MEAGCWKDVGAVVRKLGFISVCKETRQMLDLIMLAAGRERVKMCEQED